MQYNIHRVITYVMYNMPTTSHPPLDEGDIYAQRQIDGVRLFERFRSARSIANSTTRVKMKQILSILRSCLAPATKKGDLSRTAGAQNLVIDANQKTGKGSGRTRGLVGRLIAAKMVLLDQIITETPFLDYRGLSLKKSTHSYIIYIHTHI
jgi:hypothetical protein